MNTFLNSTMTFEIARQRRAGLESTARRHRLARFAGRHDARRRGRDPGATIAPASVAVDVAMPHPATAPLCCVA
jgi:hypothetical protein